MNETVPLYSLKKPTQWLWRTGFTQDQVLARLEESRISGDWLICPLGDANKATTVACFVSNPDFFAADVPRASQDIPGTARRQTSSAADAARHDDARFGAVIKTALVGLSLTIALVLYHAVLIFWPAGRLDWTRGRIFVGLLAVGGAVVLSCVLRWNPALIARRLRLGEGAKHWDFVLVSIIKLAWAAIHIVAGFEARGGGSNSVGVMWLLGLSIFVIAAVLTTWVLVSNPFFEEHVRIQHDNQHRVVDRGPYAIVRHPGYVGFSSYLISVPLLLGSPWAFVPTIVFVVVIVIRTVLEDRTLRDELPGYKEYAERVRFRLIPGIW